MYKIAKQVVVLLAHPGIKSSQANKALADAIKELEEVAISNLYEMRPEDAFNVDLWSKIISQASTLVFQFPLYWMSAPSLLKKWQDEVLLIWLRLRRWRARRCWWRLLPVPNTAHIVAAEETTLR